MAICPNLLRKFLSSHISIAHPLRGLAVRPDTVGTGNLSKPSAKGGIARNERLSAAGKLATTIEMTAQSAKKALSNWGMSIRAPCNSLAGSVYY